MPEQPYSNRELDEKFERVEEVSNENRHSLANKIQNLQNVVELRLADMSKSNADSLQRIELQNEVLDQKVSYTNGKVRKIIVALIAVSAFTMGLGIEQLSPLLKLFVAI